MQNGLACTLTVTTSLSLYIYICIYIYIYLCVYVCTQTHTSAARLSLSGAKIFVTSGLPCEKSRLLRLRGEKRSQLQDQRGAGPAVQSKLDKVKQEWAGLADGVLWSPADPREAYSRTPGRLRCLGSAQAQLCDGQGSQLSLGRPRSDRFLVSSAIIQG